MDKRSNDDSTEAQSILLFSLLLLATFNKINRENYQAVEYLCQPAGCLFWGSCHCPNITKLQYDLSFYANCVRLSLTTFSFDRVFDSVIISILSIIFLVFSRQTLQYWYFS